jgi:two-component sensor histidine kinase
MDGSRRLRTTIGYSDHMARDARRLLASTLEGWDAATEAEELSLAINELVVNSQMYARSDVELVVRLDDRVCRVEVHDSSPILPARRTHANSAATGRGLVLVDGTVDRWGVVGHELGKHVWVEIDR